MQTSLETKRIMLRPIERKDYDKLFEWRNDTRFTMLLGSRRLPINRSKFRFELLRDSKNGRHPQFIIIDKRNGIAIGTVYSSNYNSTDGYVYLSIYIEAIYEGKGIGIQSIALFVQYLFDNFPLYKIYLETYEYNILCFSSLKSAGLIEEGRFKHHRFHGGKRYDLIRFALYRENLKTVSKFLTYFQKNKHEKSLKPADLQ